ncbi:flagellar basal-body MS-ring/collar protein FliF [Edaphobacter sp. 12200R-103]|uniref:flagellar basal-body MS-ring/collar protein FliF n=1 Tax=Edaphobacter sp. 12200R-103 TaxID=2703788 RepID=UPI00138C7FE7|nr:flagellar basal-body MS-ring/collar protein FliF [Edaphobacter sp. 12200R-103]QHS51157.1 flagellar M-ring protein FliF [Edaphobacter sp. 12200R-103]
MAETVQTEGGELQRAEPAIPASGMVDRAAAAVSSMRDRVMSLPAGQRNSLLAFTIFIASMAVAMMWYAGRRDWKPLFTGLDGKDVQQVSQELAAAGIPYQMTSDGSSIEVPAEMVDKARMEIAAKGMPQTGRLGFELFDKPNWVGSEFDEKVNYQRALEGELEHTISTLGVVRSARVHLVLPKQSLFTSEERAAKASVVLKLKRPFLGEEQADAIRSLVAGAVENLSPDDVNLVDADGRVNLKPRSKNAVAADVEQEMEAKLVAMLEPLAGHDNVRATVNVSYMQGTEERTDEIYDPNQSATLSLQKSEQVSEQAQRAMGVPGTASNSPAGAPTGAVQGSQAAAAPGMPPLLQKEALPVYPQQGNGAGQSVREESGTYGVTKHTIHSEEGPGRVRRVTAAVVVNDRAVVEGTGKTQRTEWKPRSAEEMRRLEQLAQAAVGFDTRRGDQVVVENISFSSNSPELKPPVMEQVMEQARTLARTQPGLAKTLIIGFCAVLLVLCVLRPMARQVVEALRAPALLTGDNSMRETPQTPALMSEAIVGAPALPSKTKEQMQHQGIFEQVAEHIRREPVQSTRLLEAWIGSSEEMDV